MDTGQCGWRAAESSGLHIDEPPDAVGGESFIFGRKVNNRVTIVGERTAGAGHFGRFVDLPGGFVSFVSHGRTYDPRTNEGWEAEGIEPHVLVPAADALNTALWLIRGRT